MMWVSAGLRAVQWGGPVVIIGMTLAGHPPCLIGVVLITGMAWGARALADKTLGGMANGQRRISNS